MCVHLHAYSYVYKKYAYFVLLCTLQLQTQIMFNYECSDSRCLKLHLLVPVDAVVAALAILLSSYS